MKQMTSDEVFIGTVKRINRILVIMGVFYLLYFLFQTSVNIFLILLALSNVAFALLSHKHLMITDKLALELDRAKISLGDVSKEMREIHPDRNA
ncbi:MAG: hypothetical protein HQ532_03245 [Candidatus Omnitrophica bacterium]|nr:hypothetical protein [Candidatus Omnitrophota bacterium]